MSVPGTAYCVRTLRPLLPDAAFRPAPGKLATAGLHVAIVIAGWLAIRYLPVPYWPLATLAIGVSLGAIAFLAHEAIHGSVVRSRPLRDVAEIALFSLLLIPRTVYRRVHHLHHRSTNSLQDPDRRFLAEELTGAAPAYTRMFFPNRQWRYAALWFQHFIAYSIRHTIAAFTSRLQRLGLMTAVPAYTQRERLAIGLEISIILALQGAIWFIVGAAFPHRLAGYLFAVPLPIGIMSAAVSLYFFTNHGLKPVGEEADVLAGTTSIAVPRAFDWLHCNFSYHVEHHLFPTVSSDYYPLVSGLLRQHFGRHYHRVAIGGAWAALLRSDLAARRREPAAPAMN